MGNVVHGIFGGARGGTRRRARHLLLALLVLSSSLLTCGRGPTRHTYHVTEAQLHQMGQIAGIAPCPHGPTIVAAVKRAHGGGLVHVECPGAGRR